MIIEGMHYNENCECENCKMVSKNMKIINMRIEIDKNYIVSLKTKAEYEEFSKITPWYDNLAGIPDWREYPDEGGFALRVENGEIKGFDNLNNYNGYIDFRDYILITILDNSFNLVSSNSSKRY